MMPRAYYLSAAPIDLCDCRECVDATQGVVIWGWVCKVSKTLKQLVIIGYFLDFNKETQDSNLYVFNLVYDYL